MSSLLLKNIGILQTPIGNFKHCGQKQGENLKIENAAIYIEDDTIKEIFKEAFPKVSADREIDCRGSLVTPGLIDGHTHAVFGGYRENEVPLKIKGASYLEILRQGGGILQTVTNTRKESFDQLYEKTRKFTSEMMTFGTTTCEAKSGYGLDLETEVKMLEVLKKVNDNSDITIVRTFMGPHATPPEYKGRNEEYLKLVCEKMLPVVKEKNLAEFTDIFCEDSVFNRDESKYYMEESKKLGFKLRIHADEIEEIGGSVLAGQMEATTAEHLIAIGDSGIESMAKGGTIAMLLPATSFYLNKNYAPARKFVEAGVPVSLATDFNPGSCPSLNIQFVINLAYLRYRLMPEEILTGVTINPACGLGIENERGSLEVGKKADIVIWDAPNMEMLCYRLGSNLVRTVIKEGKVVV